MSDIHTDPIDGPNVWTGDGLQTDRRWEYVLAPRDCNELTSALGVRQTANVLATVDKVRKSSIAVVFITHNVRHALAVGDRFTVLNRGKTLGTAKRGEITPEKLQDLMAGGMEMATLEGSLGGTV